MEVIQFRYFGRFGLFLRPETGTSWLSYPVPPRTALLGLLGAILGLPKDTPQQEWEGAAIAVSGKAPVTHWHHAQVRQDTPELLPFRVKAKSKPKTSKGIALPKLQRQEWLLDPEYVVTVHLPGTWQEQLSGRLREERLHFTPCMGLSEMLARVEWLGEHQAVSLPKGHHSVSSVVLESQGTLDAEQALFEGLALQWLRLPRQVNKERVFHQANYIFERENRPLPVTTDQAWQVGDDVVMFL